MTDERFKPSPASRVSKTDRAKRGYVRPELVEYGSIAKLTQSGGSSVMEGGVPFMAQAMCL